MSNSQKFNKLLKEIDYCSDRLVGVIVHLNDTYLLEERKPFLPGFSRVIATIQCLREHTKKILGYDRVLVLHSGDFLGPSRVTNTRKGREAMINLLNKMGVDFCLLGNHEFDHKEDELVSLLEAANFQILISNVTTPNNIKATNHVQWPQKKPVVALAGVVSKTVHSSFPSGWDYTDPKETLKQFALQSKNIPFRIVLSHANRNEDRDMRTVLSDVSRSYILGGHDHDLYAAENDDYPILMKNLSNLRTVRVVLLLAGGNQALNQLNKNYDLHVQPEENNLLYPRDSKTFFKGSFDCDKKVFKSWLDDENPSYARPNHNLSEINYKFFTDSKTLPLNALANRMTGFIYTEDMWNWLLRSDDHLNGNSDDEKIVNEALKSVSKDDDEEIIVCDFSSETRGELEAREEFIRSGPTDFGEFVAECIRRKGSADISIVHSGSFRSDAQLPAKLRIRDLRDTFLYDWDEAICVLNMDKKLVDKLVDHGHKKRGTGAYPQISGNQESEILKVAISSHLITNDTDLYASIIAKHFDKKKDDLINHLDIENKYSIESAILDCGKEVGYMSVPLQFSITDQASQFITLAKEVSLLFKKSYPPNNSHATWNNMFRSFLSSNEPIDNKELQAVRDNIRKLLRSLTAVRDYDKLKIVPSNGWKQNIEILNQQRNSALKDLGKLRTDIRQHQRTFEDGLIYCAIFDAAATGIAEYKP